MIFAWNIIAWIAQMLPPRLNQPKTNTWAQAFVSPVITLYNDFMALREQLEIKVRVKWQTIIIQAYLNDLFDPVQRRILVYTAYDELVPNFVYTKAENKPLYIYTKAENKPVYVYTVAEYGVLYDFVVQAQVGSLTGAQIIRLKAIVAYYQYASRIGRFQYNNGVPF